MLASAAAKAEPIAGLYIAGGVGGNIQANSLVASRATDFPNALFGGVYRNSWSEPGVVLQGSIGWGFRLNQTLSARLEGEVSYRTVNTGAGTWTTRTGFTNNLNPPVGNLNTFAFMANGLLEMSVGPINPYIGGGVGVALNNYDNIGGRSLQSPSEAWRFSGDSTRFAYQLIAGVALPIAAVPGLSLTTEYRYFATLRNPVRGEYLSTIFLPSPQPLNTHHTNANHSLQIGLRYNFGQTASAPVLAKY